jgi:hypothetical protein
MITRHRSLFSALVLLCTALAAPSARALVIKASDYAVGTNLTHAFPGVTLEYATNGPGFFSTSPLMVDASQSDLGPLNFNSLGSVTHGSDCYPPFNSGCGWQAVYAVFHRPVEAVTAITFADYVDEVYLSIFDIHGNLLGTTASSETCVPANYPGAPLPCYGYMDTASLSSGTPIAYLLVGSYSAAAYVTEIDIPGVVPEPPSFALLAAGLLASGILTLRRRRRA